MNKLEVLNTTMGKQDHGVTLPMSLRISINGHLHTVTIDREDKNIQKTVRALVMMMLRNEIETAEKTVKSSRVTLYNAKDADNVALQDYEINVVTEWRPGGPEGLHGELGTPEGYVYTSVMVCAHSERDARVMAFILKGEFPEDATPTHILALADQYTEIV